MYKALELYPLNGRGWEYPVKTENYSRRMKSIDWRSPRIITPYYKGLPTLQEYLDLAEQYHWDLSRDINYAYAQVLYPPENIKLRILRIYNNSHKLHNCISNLSFILDRQFVLLSCTINYNKTRTLKTYGAVMRYISQQEQQQGFDDALDFEE